ncbi:MAG: hypothetical protein CL483_13100 [Acidobacteria bacterium]|nr:hypothetical protein [Acidobacteriota bacterium]
MRHKDRVTKPQIEYYQTVMSMVKKEARRLRRIRSPLNPFVDDQDQTAGLVIKIALSVTLHGILPRWRPCSVTPGAMRYSESLFF